MIKARLDIGRDREPGAQPRPQERVLMPLKRPSRSARELAQLGGLRTFATGFLHELKCCRQIPVVAVHRRRAAKLIVVDPHQSETVHLDTKEVGLVQT
jgi:hypothetical protein